MQITLDISDKFALALGGLSDAIRALSTGEHTGAVEHTTSASDDTAETGPIYWADNTTGYFGVVDDEAGYRAQKKKAPDTVKITKSIYDKKLAELKKKNEAEAADAKAKKAAADEKKAAANSSKKTETKAAATDDHPSIEELVEVFSRYLPKDLTKEERAERAGFVKPLLQRFGAAKATELLPEHRALAMNLVERKMAGEDIDPTSSDFAEVAAASEDDLV